MMRTAMMIAIMGPTSVVLNVIPRVNERIHKIAPMRMRIPKMIPTITFP